jgi:hypothetical protein
MSNRANDFGLAGHLITVDAVTSGSQCGARFAPTLSGLKNLQPTDFARENASFGCRDHDRWSGRQRAMENAHRGGDSPYPGRTLPF